MVFSSLNPTGETYMLWKRFRMPTLKGSTDAVAVRIKTAGQLNSAYTFMLEYVVLLAWGIIVIVGLLISILKYHHDHPENPSRPFSEELYNKRSSPFDILKLSVKHFSAKGSRRWLVVAWIVAALCFVVVKHAVPIVFAPYILIGNAAPVNPDSIFVPSRNGSGNLSDQTSDLLTMQVFEFNLPSALRAVDSVDNVIAQMAGQKANPLASSVSVDQPEILQVRQDGERVMNLRYRYNVTGLDLGLQNYHDLLLTVTGSCTTEYNWNSYEGPSDDFPGAFVDAYTPFNNTGLDVFVSKYDGGPPMAYFGAIKPSSTDRTNTSWYAVISSVNRTSYWSSSDPWYRTFDNPLLADNPQLPPFMVMPARPPLSCWQTDVWSYKNSTSDITNLLSLHELDLPYGLRIILVSYLSRPVIVSLGQYLRANSLASSSTANSFVFNANSSSIYNDLRRLVYASYIATVNTFTETTLYSPYGGFLNEARYQGALLNGAAEFVIFSNDISTLSVRTLIIVPTLALSLWIIFLTLMFLRPGKIVSKLKPEKPVAGKETAEEPEQQDDSKGEEKLGEVISSVAEVAMKVGVLEV